MYLSWIRLRLQGTFKENTFYLEINNMNFEREKALNRAQKRYRNFDFKVKRTESFIS